MELRKMVYTQKLHRMGVDRAYDGRELGEMTPDELESEWRERTMKMRMAFLYGMYGTRKDMREERSGRM